MFWKTAAAFLFITVQSAVAQEYAPATLAVGSTVVYDGTVFDPQEGTYNEQSTVRITSPTTFQGGTYSYTRTGNSTAKITFTLNYSEPGYTETETTTTMVTFTNYGVGTYTSSGTYSGNDSGFPFSGSFTGNGTFTYNGPVISNVADRSTLEDIPTGAIPFTVGDSQTAANSLTVTRASSNLTLVPLANIVLGGSGNNRTVTVTPAANQSGTATITLTVTDTEATATGPLTATDTFVLTVTAVNDPPTISDVADRSTNEDTGTGAIAFSVGDVETAAGSLVVTRASSNLTLVPLANIVLGGSGANRTATITPAANQSGSSTITLTVSDGVNTTSDTFVLTVNPVNDAPTISDVTNKTTNEDTPTGAIAFTVGDIDNDVNLLAMSAGSSNLTLVPLANIVFGGSGASRTVTVTPAANQSGTATITLTVSDGSLTASDTFLLTVNGTNDAPTISDVPDQTTSKGTAIPAIPFTIDDAETPAASLTVTRATSNATLIPLANLVLGGSGANRTVTVTPAANQTGTATVTLTVSDGVLTAMDTFLVTVVDGQTIAGWRQTYFMDPANSGDGADLNDFDKDGIVNLMEYALGTNPKLSSSATVPAAGIETVLGQPYLTLTVTKPAGVTGITYVVEVGGTLNGWNSGAGNTTVITDNATTLKVRDNTPATGGSRFIRLKVTNP